MWFLCSAVACVVLLLSLFFLLLVLSHLFAAAFRSLYLQNNVQMTGTLPDLLSLLTTLS